jgi:ATP-dependent RNA helicase RhlE
MPRAHASAPIAFEAVAHDPTPVAFAELGLHPGLNRALAEHQFEKTTPVQSAVFPHVMSGIDLVGCAETGTGKTAAFLLPIMQRLLDARRDAEDAGDPPLPQATRVLVLAPTRELALQIEEDFQGLGYHTGLSGAAVFGGVAAGPQDRALRAGVDLIVATPGRLLDHINSNAANFGSVEVLVLDEADRMLDMGFWPDVRRIVSTLPVDRQTLLFSATMSDEVTRSAAQIMRNPKLVQIGRTGGLATTITHEAHVVPSSGEKVHWLTDFLRRTHEPTIVFVRTKILADRLGRRLADGRIRLATLHADRSQEQRLAAVEGFKSGRHKVLVATDIAARGLDIDSIGYVINYEVPGSVDAYVHRVGRTGRAEATGHALTLASPEEIPALRALEKALKLQLLDPAELEALAAAQNGDGAHHGGSRNGASHHGGGHRGAAHRGASHDGASQHGAAQPTDVEAEQPAPAPSGSFIVSVDNA